MAGLGFAYNVNKSIHKNIFFTFPVKIQYIYILFLVLNHSLKPNILSVVHRCKEKLPFSRQKTGSSSQLKRERQEENSETEKDRGGYGGLREQVQTVMQSNSDKAVEKLFTYI